MTTEVVKTPQGLALQGRVPESTELPPLPPELTRALRMTNGEASDRYLPRPGELSILQAVAAIPAYSAAALPTGRAVIDGWLDRVALSVANPPGAEGRKAKGAAIIALSGDLPAVCWTMETWRAFLRRGPDARFWPAAADVDGFLRAIADQHQARLAMLHRIAAVGSEVDTRDPAPPEELSEAARMTAAERGDVISAIRAKHGLPPSGALPPRWKAVPDMPPAVVFPTKPVDAAALQAFRIRCRALLALDPLPIIATEVL